MVEAVAFGAGEVFKKEDGLFVDAVNGFFIRVGLAGTVKASFGGEAGNEIFQGRLVSVVVFRKFFEDVAEGPLDEVDHGAVAERGVAEVGGPGDLLLVEPAGDPLLRTEAGQVGGR